jgi:hypothetical protein
MAELLVDVMVERKAGMSALLTAELKVVYLA